jgi:hypothetical protein
MCTLQEINRDRDQKEKYPEGKLPDYSLATVDFEGEHERCILLLRD